MSDTRLRFAVGLLPLILCVPACQQQMASQPSYRPDQPNAFFEDGRAARPLVAGTVARGHLRTDQQLFYGTSQPDLVPQEIAAAAVGAGAVNLLAVLNVTAGVQLNTTIETAGFKTFPFPITAKVLDHGRNRFMIYCVVCHDPIGTGRGMIVERGYTPPPSYHIDRLRNAPPGHFFEVITRGYGSMPSYAHQIPPRDRWAIAAYIGALQLSQHFAVNDLPPDMWREWQEHDKPAPPGGRQQ